MATHSGTSHRLDAQLRRLERRLGLDRQGRTTWVWALPIASGVIIGLLFGIMPGIDLQASWSARLLFGVFGFLTTLGVSVICMISFDRDRNQDTGDDPDE